ncbi:BrnA antitoxin family protein [Perlucidibaca aquatica]|jgi:uncharacterized protein (DUF4415 family)|uniref:BrnA antitoxin family protein n=1 Tax=Perlucidibaca aquatica TaxID=1852776 RepID=UPI00083B7E75|nr:BrnA antitoxin family protein [Perlucidibaca aquatica]
MNAKSSTSASKAASQPDETNPEWMADDFQHARRAEDVLPEILGKEQASVLLTRGRPKSSNPKVALTIRYDAEVIESFRATGPGWQTRMNSALREWLTLKH